MRRALLTFIGLLLACSPAAAQPAPPALVGRVAYVTGDLAFHMPDETVWSAAQVNYPVASGGDFWVYPQSRAEFRVGPQTIEIDGGSEIDVVQLTESAMELSLPQGRLYLHLRGLQPGGAVRIDLARGAVSILRPGIYDIDAGSDSEPSHIAVFEGEARFQGGSADLDIRTGEALTVGGASGLSTGKARADSFDQWARARDYNQQPQAAALRHVSADMTGYADLDEYGSWSEVSGYGAVWYPREVAADWAPYRDGHWVWVAPWGWTWVDAQPWGFAPFHYGRWAHIGGRWGWVPGRYEKHPVYAPALVAFVGGPDRGIELPGARGPAVGWFPLAPGEVYWPSYTRNPSYIRNVNITNVSVTKITNITKVIVNQTAAAPPPQVVRQVFANRAAATVVPVKTFATAARIDPKASLHVVPQALAQAPISVQPPPVAATAARLPPPRPVPAAVKAAAAHPPVAVHGSPAAAHPASPAAIAHLPSPAQTPAAAAHLAPPAHAPGTPAGPATAAVHPATTEHQPSIRHHLPPPQAPASTHVVPAVQAPAIERSAASARPPHPGPDHPTAHQAVEPHPLHSLPVEHRVPHPVEPVHLAPHPLPEPRPARHPAEPARLAPHPASEPHRVTPPVEPVRLAPHPMPAPHPVEPARLAPHPIPEPRPARHPA